MTHLSDLDVIRVLKGGGQLFPGGGHGFAVTAPRGEELDEVSAWKQEKSYIKNKAIAAM